MNKVLLPKEHNDLPDSYGVKVLYYDGSEFFYDIVSHKFINDIRCVEIITKEDTFLLLPLDTIKTFEFDKRFSTIVALKEKNKSKRG